MTDLPSPLRVLLVEDNPGDARLVELYLGEATKPGFEVDLATTMREAQGLMSTRAYEVVILDLHLPDAVGLDTVRGVLTTDARLAIVVLSGADDEAMSLQAVNAGAQDYLVKGRIDSSSLSRALMYAVERKRALHILEHKAHHDALTGLPNRARLDQVLPQALARARRGGRPLGVLYLDLDMFKEVNDTLGHEAGDEVLQVVAQRLQETVRQTDTVARLGGDEFVVVLELLQRPEDALLVGRKLLACLSRPMAISKGEVTIGASAGLALSRPNVDDSESMLRRADGALYLAKGAGRGLVRTDPDSHLALNGNAGLVELVRDAADGQGFQLHYQPIVSLLSGRTMGSEAFLRLMDHEGNVRTAAELVPVLAATGLLSTVGPWTLARACGHEARRRAKGLAHHEVSVNVSATEVRSPTFLTDVATAITASGLSPAELVIDLHHDALEDDEHLARALGELSAMGVTLALDGFGAGTTTIARFVQLPLRRVKLDGALTRNLPSSAASQRVVGRLIAVAQALELEVGAGRVEVAAEREILQRLGCDHIQGWLVGRAVPALEIA